MAGPVLLKLLACRLGVEHLDTKFAAEGQAALNAVDPPGQGLTWMRVSQHF